jgi:hypothetical protein
MTGKASGAEMDADGRFFIPGYIVAPGCDERLSEDKFYSCPLAEIVRPHSQIQEAIQSHRRLTVSGIRLVDLYPSPTPAILSALGEMDITLSSLREEKERREMEEAKRRRPNG